jgi:hypothetical protein
MSTAVSSTPASSNYKEPLSRRINLRMIIFAGVILVLIGFPLYTFIDSAVHEGVKNAGDHLEVDLKAMGNFPFDPVNGTINDVPPKYRALDGKRIQLQGEVWAPNEAGDRMTQFQLVYSIAKCCFGGPPRVQERVFAQVPKDLEVPNLTYRFAKVTGTLHISSKKPDGAPEIGELYTLDVDKVEPMQ